MGFRAEWEAWRPEVPLLTLHSAHRSLAKPIVRYLSSVEAQDKYHRLVVLIPEVEPSRPWEWVLHNQRGIILERAIRRGTSNVVLCRLRYRLADTHRAGRAATARGAGDARRPVAPGGPPAAFRIERSAGGKIYAAWVTTRGGGGDHASALRSCRSGW